MGGIALGYNRKTALCVQTSRFPHLPLLLSERSVVRDGMHSPHKVMTWAVLWGYMAASSVNALLDKSGFRSSSGLVHMIPRIVCKLSFCMGLIRFFFPLPFFQPAGLSFAPVQPSNGRRTLLLEKVKPTQEKVEVIKVNPTEKKTNCVLLFF